MKLYDSLCCLAGILFMFIGIVILANLLAGLVYANILLIDWVFS